MKQGCLGCFGLLLLLAVLPSIYDSGRRLVDPTYRAMKEKEERSESEAKAKYEARIQQLQKEREEQAKLPAAPEPSLPIASPDSSGQSDEARLVDETIRRNREDLGRRPPQPDVDVQPEAEDSVDANAYLEGRPGAPVVCATTHRNLVRLSKVVIDQDEVGIVALRRTGAVFPIPARTLAQVIERDATTAHVVIADGSNTGRHCWLPTDFVKSR